MPATSLERFRAFVSRTPMDRSLRYAHFCPDLERRLADDIGEEDLTAYFHMDVCGYVGPKPPENYVFSDYTGYYSDLPDNALFDELGVAMEPGSMYHFVRRISPLCNATKLRELETYPVDTCEDWTADHMNAEVEDLHRRGQIAAGAMSGIYEGAWHIRGLEQFLIDMVSNPEWCDVLLDKVMAHRLNVAKAAAKAGVDVIMFGENVANQTGLTFSLELWRKFVKPRWAQIWSSCQEINPDVQVRYHGDGNIESIIDELREIGVTILNPIQPECMDLDKLIKKHKGQLLFDGGIGTQTVMPFGTPADIRACVFERVEQFGQDLIVAPTHTLEPEVSIENVKAFFDSCDSVCFKS